MDVRDGLTFLNSSTQVPTLIKEWFKYEWVDYVIVERVIGLFNKYFTTKSYVGLKKGMGAGGEKFVEGMLDGKNNLEQLRDCEYYLSATHPRGLLLSICSLYCPFLTFSHSANLPC